MRVSQWSERVARYFNADLFMLQKNHGLNLDTINATSIFNPVLPVFERQGGAVNVDASSSGTLVAVSHTTHVASNVILSGADSARFLDEQRRSMAEKLSALAKTFPDGGKLITVAEANLLVALQVAQDVTTHLVWGVNYIEHMLRRQLIAAIGKEVTPLDFANYMHFHNHKVFREQFAPQKFAYAIRRPDHYPEGILSIEQDLLDGTPADPIETFVSHHVIAHDRPMHFAISASAKVAFTGEVYLHGWVKHQFEGQTGSQMTLSARARQFSSFLILVGTVGGPALFDPKFGIVCQNKDEVMIPLKMETIPTPKEFRDAIESLSPEQQRFCQAFRAMQLASTLFGVCVIQIKPQLEKVLKLDNDSLTKEIRLTQSLLDLFLQWQIPSDLLSFGGAAAASGAAKLSGVKGNVQALEDMIAGAKQKELEEKMKEAEMRLLQDLGSCSCVCPAAGHKMSVIIPYEGKGWNCDGCKNKGPTRYAMSCVPCGYDLCLPCARKRHGVPYTPPRPPSPTLASRGGSARAESMAPMMQMMSGPPMSYGAPPMPSPMRSAPPPSAPMGRGGPPPSAGGPPPPPPMAASAPPPPPPAASAPPPAPVVAPAPATTPATNNAQQPATPTPTPVVAAPTSALAIDYTTIPTGQY